MRHLLNEKKIKKVQKIFQIHGPKKDYAEPYFFQIHRSKPSNLYFLKKDYADQIFFQIHRHCIKPSNLCQTFKPERQGLAIVSYTYRGVNHTFSIPRPSDHSQD